MPAEFTPIADFQSAPACRVGDHTPQEKVCGWGGVPLVFGDVHHKLRLTTASAVFSEYQFRFITFIAEEWP
jgi:hypothetical protein